MGHKIKSNEISDWVFGHISSFLGIRWLQAVPDGNSEKDISASVPQGSILGITFFPTTN